MLILNTLACNPQIAEDSTAHREGGGAERHLRRDGNTAGRNESRNESIVAGIPASGR
jgi:hypothetical protein